MSKSARQIDRRTFLTHLGAGFAGLTMLGCGSPPAPGRIGRRIEQGGLAVLLRGAVTRTAFGRYNATSTVGPDQIYLLMRTTVQNVSAPRFEVSPVAFTLTSAEGRIFKPLSVGFHVPEPSHTALTPGGSSSDPAVFEIPSASTGLTLSFQPVGIPEAIRFEVPPPAELPSEPDA